MLVNTREEPKISQNSSFEKNIPKVAQTQLYLNQKLGSQAIFEDESFDYFIDLQAGGINVLVEWIDFWDIDLTLTVALDSEFTNIIAFSDDLSYQSPETVDAFIYSTIRLYIRVHSKSGSGIFSILVRPASISISNPNSGSSWEVGTSQTILWSSVGLFTTVDISLYKGDVFYQNIATNTPNDGSQIWNIPYDLTAGSDYSIKIVYDIVTGESNQFTIITPTITVLNPSSGISWEVSTTETISWSTTGGITSVDIILYKGGVFYQNIVFETPNDGSYSWLIPPGLSTGSDYTIKIVSGIFNGESDQFTIFRPTITVLNPTSGTSWQAGTSHTITWSTTGTITSLHIKLIKGGILNQELAFGTANDGSYLWDIPYDLTPDSDYSIFLESGVYYDESDQFTISDPPPESINILTPNSGTSWQAVTSQTISWSSVGLFTTVDITLYKGGVFNRNIAIGIPNDGSYSWLIPGDLAEGSDYSVKIEHDTISDESDQFNIYLPTITILSPISSTSWQTYTSQTISWSTTGIITSVDINLYKGGILNQNIVFGTPNDGSYLWLIPGDLTDGSDYSVKIEYDTISDESDHFNIFNPTITVLNPTSGTSWIIDTTQTISWSTTGIITLVDINLYKGGILNQNIAIGTPNDGSYSWVIPGDLTEGSDYSIKIEYNIVFDESDLFIIAKQSSSTKNGVTDDSNDDSDDTNNDSTSVPGFQIEFLIIAIMISTLFITSIMKKRMKFNETK